MMPAMSSSRFTLFLEVWCRCFLEAVVSPQDHWGGHANHFRQDGGEVRLRAASWNALSSSWRAQLLLCRRQIAPRRRSKSRSRAPSPNPAPELWAAFNKQTQICPLTAESPADEEYAGNTTSSCAAVVRQAEGTYLVHPLEGGCMSRELHNLSLDSVRPKLNGKTRTTRAERR